MGGRVLIRDRKPEISGDYVSRNRIIADDLSAVTSGTYLMTHTTNSLFSAATPREAIAKFRAAQAEATADSLFSVTRAQTRFYRADGSAVNHDPGNLVRTQDLEPWFEENSNFYLFTADSFRRTNARIGTRPMMYEIAKTEAVDIDTQEDWDMAEALLQFRAAGVRERKA